VEDVMVISISVGSIADRGMDREKLFLPAAFAPRSLTVIRRLRAQSPVPF
jgi:hypothetical protein